MIYTSAIDYHGGKGEYLFYYMTIILDKFIKCYKSTKEKVLQSELALGKGVICYPYVVSHPELIEIEENSMILGNSRLQVYPELTGIKARIRIGKNCLIGYSFCILAGENVTIGDECSIASKVCIVSENHGLNPLRKEPYGEQPLVCASVCIENGCWIGENVTILPGVTIGERAVVGAGAVVTKDIPAYSMAVGNPAHVIKKFDFEQQRWR